MVFAFEDAAASTSEKCPASPAESPNAVSASVRNARPLFDVMGELRKATAGLNDEEKSYYANKIAGTEAQKGLLAVLNASGEDYDKLASAIGNADGAASSMADTMLDNLQGSLTLLQSAVDGAKTRLGERLSPYVREIAGWSAPSDFDDAPASVASRVNIEFSAVPAMDALMPEFAMRPVMRATSSML